MINSLTDHMELFDFTLWNKSQLLPPVLDLKERAAGRIQGLGAAVAPDQRLHVRFESRPAAPSRERTRSPMITGWHLQVGFPRLICGVNTSWSCEYKCARRDYSGVASAYWESDVSDRCRQQPSSECLAVCCRFIWFTQTFHLGLGYSGRVISEKFIRNARQC